MEGQEGEPKEKSVWARLATVSRVAKRVYMAFVPPPGLDEVNEKQDKERELQIEDVAKAICKLDKPDRHGTFTLAEVMFTLGYGKSKNIDFFKEFPVEDAQVRRVLQMLVDEKILVRNMSQDPETRVVITSWRFLSRERIFKRAGLDEKS